MRRLTPLILAILVLGGGVYWYKSRTGSGTGNGGRLVATHRTEPASFNRIVAPLQATELASRLTNATLVRVDRTDGTLMPGLASDWSGSPDGLTFTLHLRPGLLFSDGVPFSAADVLFTFKVLYDPKVASPVASGMMIGGRPLLVRALDDQTISVTFPEAYGPGLAILDDVPILPQHKLEAAYSSGNFAAAWGPGAPVTDFAGLGPFVLADYQSGQHMRFARNPHYFGKDASGRQLPYLEEIQVDFVPEQNAEMVRLEAGTADLVTEQVRAEDIASLEAAQSAGRVKLVDAGVGIDVTGLWFNLSPTSPRAKDRPWLQREELRRAISMAVNRQQIVDTVFLGAAEPAWGPITRGHGIWYRNDLPHPAFDPDGARQLLAGLGFKDGRRARFSVLTRKGNTAQERTMANVQEQLAKVGIDIDVVAVEQRALITQFSGGDYDAIYFGAPASSIDPTINADFWLSSGSFHFWNPGQTSPATPWEQQIDDLMHTVSATTDQHARVAAFADVQRVFAAHLPIVYFAAPKVTIATSARVTGAAPTVLPPQILWKPETLSLTKR